MYTVLLNLSSACRGLNFSVKNSTLNYDIDSYFTRPQRISQSRSPPTRAPLHVSYITQPSGKLDTICLPPVHALWAHAIYGSNTVLFAPGWGEQIMARAQSRKDANRSPALSFYLYRPSRFRKNIRFPKTDKTTKRSSDVMQPACTRRHKTPFSLKIQNNKKVL